MGRKNPQQIAVLDILDWLYFNQVLVFSVYSQTDREWLKRIVDRISHSVSETGATGLEAEYLKHCVLCFLELFLADDIDKFRELDINAELPELPAEKDRNAWNQLKEYQRDYFTAFVLAVNEQAHGKSITLAGDIATGLQEQFLNAPASVRYRLADRCMAYEHKEAPLDFFTWLTELQIINCAKYRSEKLTIRLPELAITRIGLLCEFEILRRSIGRQYNAPNMAEIMLKAKTSMLPQSVAGSLLEIKHKLEKLTYTAPLTWITFDINRRLDSIYVTSFFNQMAHYFDRIRLWQGSQATWLGVLGGFIVEMEKFYTSPEKPIYSEINNEGTITDGISTFLRKRGFAITGRRLYVHHSRFTKEIKNKVLFYYTMLGIGKVAPPPAENGDMYYYNIVRLHHLI
jgi:hypothetical protein